MAVRASIPKALRCALALLLLYGAAAAAAVTAPQALSGVLPDGARWRVAVPAEWNGTLLLYSHGYASRVQEPALAPRDLEPWLLQHGYALAASSYARPGWAVAEAVPDQQAVLTQFSAHVGRARHIIAWGESMGGLITVALAEDPKSGLDGALSACGSVAGSLPMMNMALDGEFAFRTLIGAQATDVQQAMSSAAGRARLALAAALGGVPAWSQPDTPQPSSRDFAGQLEQVARTFGNGVFLPREDQEQRAGGRFSWNSGVDYSRLLVHSGRRAWVNEYYREAGLDLGQDLKALEAAPRIRADAGAVAYMRAHYLPSGMLQVPLLSYHTIGDGLTSPLLEGEFEREVQRAGRGTALRLAWVAAAGHCTFSPAEHLSALRALEARLQSGRWDVSPQRLNTSPFAPDLGPRRFIRYIPDPMPRE